MATQWIVNQTPTNGSLAMFQLVQTMISGGWVQMGSGDASTFNNSAAGPVVNGGAGATGLGNNAAWIRLEAPLQTFGGASSNREFCIQRGNADADWWIRYSVAGNFSGGSPSATVAPTAADQVNLYGTAQNAATGFFGTNNTYRCNCMCYDASGSYGFYLFTFPTGGGSTSQTAFVLDPLIQASTADKDPYILYTAGASANTLGGAVAATKHFGGDTSAMLAFMSTNLITANCITVMASVYYNMAGGLIVPVTLTVDPFGSLDHTWPIHYGRRSPLNFLPMGPKGWGTIMRYPGVSRNTGDTLSISAPGAKDYIVVQHISLPWNGSSPTV